MSGFLWVLKIQTQVLMLGKQMLSPLGQPFSYSEGHDSQRSQGNLCDVINERTEDGNWRFQGDQTS